jgi:hypothetical protein
MECYNALEYSEKMINSLFSTEYTKEGIKAFKKNLNEKIATRQTNVRRIMSNYETNTFPSGIETVSD